MAQDWTREEVEATVVDYLAMLSAERAGRAYNKAEHRRRLGKLLNERSDGAIERKHQNISAVLIELGLPYIFGYKPLRNYQRLLFEVVNDRLDRTPTLTEDIAREVRHPASPATVDDILAALVDPPEPQKQTRIGPQPFRPMGARVNYLAIEAQNQSLGRAGEEFVVEFEAARLLAARQERLAAQVEHVAVTRGDGLGYDVLSFDESGKERLVEVKTTAYGKQTPFFITSNELAVSQRRSSEYHLYRVFRFREAPRLFLRSGRLDENFKLKPKQYLAQVG